MSGGTVFVAIRKAELIAFMATNELGGSVHRVVQITLLLLKSNQINNR